MDETLNNTLKVQRAMRDLTQADLAAKAGVTRKSVNAIETGRMVPSVLLALKLARAVRGLAETDNPRVHQDGLQPGQVGKAGSGIHRAKRNRGLSNPPDNGRVLRG